MVVDIIVLAVLALSVFLGYKKGLIELSVHLCAVVIAIAATLILYRPITNFIVNTTKLDENIEEAIVSQLTSEGGEGVTAEIQNQIQNELLPSTAREFSISIIRTGVMIILYAVIRVALIFVTALANLVAKLPVLNQFNKAGGLVFGAVRGIALIYVVLLLISFFGQIQPENAVHKEIEKSFITKELYNYNIISLLIK